MLTDRTFPTIRTIDDVLPAIMGADEFIVADRGDHTIINYVVVKSDTFPSLSKEMGADDYHRAAVRRECRGLAFDRNGIIIRRPYHKFFNAGERDETQPHALGLARNNHVILDKLDGSMISPYLVGDRWIWGTRMGSTDVGSLAEQYVANNARFVDFAKWAEGRGITLMFEFCSRQQKIVIDHPDERMVLTGARQQIDGAYLTHEQLVDIGSVFEIDTVRAHSPVDCAVTLISDIRSAPLDQVGEGIVVRFHSGEMAKIKSDEYLRIHGVFDRLTEERHVVADIVDGHFDDVVALTDDRRRHDLEYYRDQVLAGIERFSRQLRETIADRHSRYPDRKQYALSPEQRTVDSKFVTRAVFWFYQLDQIDEATVRDYIVTNRVRPACGGRTDFGTMKQEVFPNTRFPA